MRKYPRSGRRQILYLPDLLAESDEYVIGCFSKPVLDIARTFLSTRGRWNTTYSTAYFDGGYTPASAVEMDQVEELIAEFLEDTSQMNCDDFLTEMQRIADAVERSAAANEACCGPGSGGAGGASEPASSFTDDGSSSYPTGYPDRPAYEVNKCQAALEIIEQLKTDFTYIRDGSIVSLATTALAAALITPIPFDDILALSAYAIALILQGVLVSTAQEVIDYLTNSEQDVICYLYNSSTVSDAMNNVDDGTMGTLASTLFAYTVNTDAFNRLFEYDQVGDYGADCSSCPCDWEVVFGSGTLRTDGVQFTLVSEWDGNNTYDIDFQLSNDCCEDDWRVHIDDVRGGPDNGGRVYTCPGMQEFFAGPTVPVGTYDNVSRVSQVDSTVTNFEMDIRIEKIP